MMHAQRVLSSTGLMSEERGKVMLAVSAAILFLILAPYIQLGVIYGYWTPNKTPVDRRTCTCNCWDTVFKGSYQGDTPGYKHLYFNITKNTMKMWILTVITLIITYETIRHLITLALNKNLRYSMFLLFAAVIYPHYYSWWSYINAWNDEFYLQWSHQTFFSVTELMSTILVVYLCDNRREIIPRVCLVIIDIAILHILASGADQFVHNVLMRSGKWHQVVRDIGFMIPDLLHIGIPSFAIWQHCKEKGLRPYDCFTNRDILCSVAGVLVLWFICANL